MVRQASRPMPGQEKEVEACRHHWVIEAPTGPVSRGMCQRCEEVRDFKNYIEAAPWGEDAPAPQPVAALPEISRSDGTEDLDDL